jgi:hypothetical protein
MQVKMESSGLVNSVNQYSGAGFVSDSGGGHRPAAPGCHPAWSPLSPSTHQMLSPRMVPGHHYGPREPGSHKHQAHMQRQFLSAVPIGVYASTPLGTSPQNGVGYIANVRPHQPQHSHPGSVRGSPGALRSAQPVHPVQYASPAHSDGSSFIPNSPGVHSGVLQNIQSPRVDMLWPAATRMLPGQLHDHAQGESRMEQNGGRLHEIVQL